MNRRMVGQTDGWTEMVEQRWLDRQMVGQRWLNRQMVGQTDDWTDMIV